MHPSSSLTSSSFHAPSAITLPEKFTGHPKHRIFRGTCIRSLHRATPPYTSAPNPATYFLRNSMSFRYHSSISSSSRQQLRAHERLRHPADQELPSIELLKFVSPPLRLRPSAAPDRQNLLKNWNGFFSPYSCPMNRAASRAQATDSAAAQLCATTRNDAHSACRPSDGSPPGRGSADRRRAPLVAHRRIPCPRGLSQYSKCSP